MQAEEAVEVDDLPCAEWRCWGASRSTRLAVRHDDVQSVRRAALEDHDQALGALPGSTAPKAARVRKLGIAVVPTTARALLRRNTRRVMDMEHLQFSVLSELELSSKRAYA